MKPADISKVLDMTRNIVRSGRRFNPLFVSPPGLGKSECVQAWAKKNGLPFIDLRAAYYEAPDLKGFPEITVQDGVRVQSFAIPEFWPRNPEWEGVIFLDEVNRGVSSTLNCFMQLLTDYKLEGYTLPRNAMIVACINPETSTYDTTTLDPALRNRFQVFQVEFDRKTFVKYAKESAWSDIVVQWVDSEVWKYAAPEDIKNNAGNKYISPRDLKALDSMIKAGIDESMEMEMYTSVLGKNYAKSFYQFKNDETPVTYADLVDRRKSSIKRLQKYADPEKIKHGHLTITVDSIVDNGEITDELLYEVLMILPTDLARGVMQQLQSKRNGKDDGLFRRMLDTYRDLGLRINSLRKTD
jgi:hypothetical protein